MVTLFSGGSFKGTGSLSESGSFRIEFERTGPDLDDDMARLGIVVREASVEAVVHTTETIKNRVRDFIDSHFTGSDLTSNNRRRASNASSQTKYYDELEAKGQYAGLVYSKFGRRYGRPDFQDFLLTHMRGATISPRQGDWLRIPNKRIGGSAGRWAQTGFYQESDASVFMVPSKDGRRLYLLRRYGRAAPNSVARTTQLLATMVKEVNIRPRLAGLESIARDRPELFERRFDQRFNQTKDS